MLIVIENVRDIGNRHEILLYFDDVIKAIRFKESKNNRKLSAIIQYINKLFFRRNFHQIQAIPLNFLTNLKYHTLTITKKISI
ncbi:MAG: hypothetical protein PHR06_12860 [Candidatus Cloacimonetes bacterium]|nr:hypothetical protein [Candidatus Cloacimonadota bacterium]